jgi:RimJ/RimL family protein N-acetyltransferase
MSTVILRSRRESDEEDLYALASDLDSWEQRTPRSPTSMTLAEFRDRQSRSTAAVTFVVEADARLAGQVTVMDEDPLARHAEIGIVLRADARGRGIGSEALRQLVRFCFVRRNLHRVHAVALATNLASLGACRNAGFVEEGRRREHAWVRGEYVDEIVMGQLRSEWDG